jgi:hypothetical protein
MNVVSEYKAQIARLRAERDIVWLLLVDEIQFNSKLSREAAEIRVTNEVFQRLQRDGIAA